MKLKFVFQFLIGTVLLLQNLNGLQNWNVFQFLIGTVLHTVSRNEHIENVKKVSIPYRYGITHVRP